MPFAKKMLACWEGTAGVAYQQLRLVGWLVVIAFVYLFDVATNCDDQNLFNSSHSKRNGELRKLRSDFTVF